MRHTPDGITRPPYYPDTREIRNNVAALHTQITLMDIEVQKILDQLEEDGLSEETIVFFYSDHGDGIPRGKRWIHETGTNVPMIIRVPEKYKHLLPAKPGSKTDKLVSFVDMAPTILSIVDLPVPDYMQGQSFFGENFLKESESVYLIRDRIDEVVDMSRGVRTQEYRYIKNYYPHRARMQPGYYSEITPIRKELRRLGSENKLKGSVKWLMESTKDAEELYDVSNDPFEMTNLASNPKYHKVLLKMRKELSLKVIETKDLSFLPESEMWLRADGNPPFELTKKPQAYPIKEIVKVANMVGTNEKSLFLSYLDYD